MFYWVKLCIIFIGILPCFTLWSCRYFMFYSLIAPFWALQYYASKLHSQQNKKFLKYTKEPYASSRTRKINNRLIYVCSWAPPKYACLCNSGYTGIHMPVQLGLDRHTYFNQSVFRKLFWPLIGWSMYACLTWVAQTYVCLYNLSHAHLCMSV